jgi:hypothetical protein
MTYTVTTDYAINKIAAPNLPTAPTNWNAQFQDQYSNVLRLYFNRIDAFISQLMATSTPTGTNTNPIYTSFSDGEVDAFGRLRVSNPYTLFDSQSRYANDSSFDTSTASGGTVSFNTNQSSTSLSVTTTSGSQAVRQTFRYFPYQPGKSFLILTTFCMAPAQANLTQRVGLFDPNNGVFLSQDGTTKNINLRSSTSGTPVTTSIPQSSWNVDRLDGTGPSGLILDLTKTQIFYTDLEWLGVGIVRTGFVIGGKYINCHTFYNANTTNTTVYMTTATLPVRYEILTTGTTSSAATLTQICCTVISEGGYEEVSQVQWARNTSTVSVPTTNVFVPMASIRLNSSHLGAVVLPYQISVLPIGAANYEVALVRNVGLTGASWVTGTFQDVDYDISATAFTSQPSGTQICQVDYIASNSQSKTNTLAALGYQWDLQLGVSLAGVSDVLTLAIRSIGATGSANPAIGALGFYDLTL